MKIVKIEIVYVLIVAAILTAVVSDWYFFNSVASMRCGPCGCQNDQCGDPSPPCTGITSALGCITPNLAHPNDERVWGVPDCGRTNISIDCNGKNSHTICYGNYCNSMEPYISTYSVSRTSLSIGQSFYIYFNGACPAILPGKCIAECRVIHPDGHWMELDTYSKDTLVALPSVTCNQAGEYIVDYCAYFTDFVWDSGWGMFNFTKTRIPCSCAPNCAGKNCGSDGCGGSCGTCTSPQKCNQYTGECYTPCVKKTCAQMGKNCGWVTESNCGTKIYCGRCESGKVCNNGNCCTPKTCSQLGKQCGTWDNGCGTKITCGECSSGYECNSSGQCYSLNDCTCSGWSGTAPNNCGMPYCNGGEMWQTRSCNSPTKGAHCDYETQCAPTSSCQLADYCIDSDNGKYPTEFGTVSGWKDWNTYSFSDLCFADGSNLLNEWYCSGTQAQSEVIQTCTVCAPGTGFC